MIRVNEIKIPLDGDKNDILKSAAKALRISPDKIKDFSVVKIFGVLFMVASPFIAVKAIEEVKENKELDPNYVAEVATDCQK